MAIRIREYALAGPWSRWRVMLRRRCNSDLLSRGKARRMVSAPSRLLAGSSAGIAYEAVAAAATGAAFPLARGNRPGWRNRPPSPRARPSKLPSGMRPCTKASLRSRLRPPGPAHRGQAGPCRRDQKNIHKRRLTPLAPRQLAQNQRPSDPLHSCQQLNRVCDGSGKTLLCSLHFGTLGLLQARLATAAANKAGPADSALKTWSIFRPFAGLRARDMATGSQRPPFRTDRRRLPLPPG